MQMPRGMSERATKAVQEHTGGGRRAVAVEVDSVTQAGAER